MFVAFFPSFPFHFFLGSKSVALVLLHLQACRTTAAFRQESLWNIVLPWSSRSLGATGHSGTFLGLNQGAEGPEGTEGPEGRW